MCALWRLTATKLEVVHTFFFGMGSIHKLAEGSLYPVNKTFPLKMTLHFVLSKSTLHPALHRGRIPMRDAIDSDRTMCLINIVKRPGMIMLHTGVDWI
jgi:hypothetical protein